MSAYVDAKTRVVVQGTGRQGSFHAGLMLDYGTPIVAGVAPGKCRGTWMGVPRVATVWEAVREYGANTSVVFVPAPCAADAICEAAAAGVGLIVCITEGIPPRDMIAAKAFVDDTGAILVGPNCPGIIAPKHSCKIGIMPAHIHRPGPIGVVSRSGTLTYEAVDQLTRLGLGQSTCIGIGGDAVAGSSFVDVLRRFHDDSDTEAVVLIGEIGGNAEQDAVRYVAETMTKPVVAFVAGASAPPGRRMGHAGAIIEGPAGTAAAKVEACRRAGVTVVDNPALIGKTLHEMLRPDNGGSDR